MRVGLLSSLLVVQGLSPEFPSQEIVAQTFPQTRCPLQVIGEGRLKNKTGVDSSEFTPPVERSDKSHYLNTHRMHLRSPLCLCPINLAQTFACWCGSPHTGPRLTSFRVPGTHKCAFYPHSLSPSCIVHTHLHVFTCTLRKELHALYPCLSFTRHALRKKEGVPASSPRIFSIPYSEVTSFLQSSSIISVLVSQGVDLMPETWVHVSLILSKYTCVQCCHVASH